MGHVIVIANPEAGCGAGPARARALAEMLRAKGATCELFVTQRLEDATRAAQSAMDAVTVVAVGGDGTVGAVVEGLMRVDAASRPRLALLPSGADGDRPDEGAMPEALLEAVLSPEDHDIDVGYLSDRDRYFASTVVLRAPVEAIREAAPAQAGRWASLAHAASDPPPPHAETRSVDMTLSSGQGSELFRAHALVIANTALMGRGGRGHLEVIALRGAPPPDLPHRVWSLVRGAPTPSGATHHVVRDASLQTSELMAVEVDGEPAGSTPVTVRLIPRAIRLCSPRSNGA